MLRRALALVVVPFSALTAQDPPKVEWLSEGPPPFPLHAVAMHTPLHAVAVGEGGTVVTTTDGGATWRNANAPGGADLRSVAFADTETLVAVGSAGVVLRSADGGRTWTKTPSPSSRELHSVAFGSSDVALAVGADGTIIRSESGGRSWTRIPAHTRKTLRAVVFERPTIAVAVGDGGTILRSTDAGLSWSEMKSGISAALRGVTVTNAGSMVAVGGDDWRWRPERVVVRSTDGGVTWSRAGDIPGGGRLYSVTGLGGPAIVAVGEKGESLRSNDGGASWTAARADSIPWLAGVDGVAGTAIAVGGSQVLRSTDGGIAWKPIAKPNAAPVSFIVEPVPGVMVGAMGPALVRSVQFGPFERTGAGGARIFDVTFIDSLTGIAVGAGGNMRRTVDGGRSWAPVKSGTGRNLRRVAFSDSRYGVAVAGPAGTGAGMIATEDGGVSWRAHPCVPGEKFCDSPGGLTDIAFHGSLGFAVGGLSAIVRSRDGGRTWSRAPNAPRHLTYRGVAILDDKRAVAVTNTGRIIRTDDGGESWSEAANDVRMPLGSVAFAGEQGVAVGAAGTILLSHDAGNSWRSVSLPVPRNFVAVSITASGDALISDANGGALRLTGWQRSHATGQEAGQ